MEKLLIKQRTRERMTQIIVLDGPEGLCLSQEGDLVE